MMLFSFFADCDLTIGQKSDEGSPAWFAGGRAGGGVGLHGFGQALEFTPLFGGEFERFADKCLCHCFSFCYGLDCGQDGAKGVGRGFTFLALERFAEIAPSFGGFLPEFYLVGDNVADVPAGGWGLVGVGGGWGWRGDVLFGGNVVAEKWAGCVEQGGLVLFGGQFVDDAAEPAGGGGGVVAEAADGDHLAVGVQSSIGQYCGIADSDLAGSDEVLDVVAEAEEFETELDADGTDSGVAGAVGDCPVIEIDAGLVSMGFVDWVYIGAGDVFGEHDGGGFLVGHVADDAGNLFPLQEGKGAEAALAGDDLEEAGFVDGADGDGLDEAVLGDVVGEFLEGIGVEDGAIVVAGGDCGAVDQGDGCHCNLADFIFQ